ncbi:hypothetical protein [Bacillus infantis]
MFKNNAERIISDIRKHSIRIDDFNDLDAAAEAAGSSQFVLGGSFPWNI